MLPYNQKYLCIDVESENLNLVKVKPWQLAWCLAEGNKITHRFNEYVDFPDFEIRDEIARMNHFSWSEYNKKKKPKQEVWEKLKVELYNPERIIIGQNLLGFDCYALASLQKYMGQKPDYSYMERIYDTRPIGKAWKEGLTKPEGGDFLSWQFKMIHDRTMKARVSQAQLLKDLTIEHDPSKLHDAVYDIEMTFKIFLELKKRMNL